MASAVTGFLATYGVDDRPVCYDDLDRCDVFITWGNNPPRCPVCLSVIDRRSSANCWLSTSARGAHDGVCRSFHSEMKPHGDLAIAGSIAHLLIKNGATDKAFVENHCNQRAERPARPDRKTDHVRRVQGARGLYARALERFRACREGHQMLADVFGDRISPSSASGAWA